MSALTETIAVADRVPKIGFGTWLLEKGRRALHRRGRCPGAWLHTHRHCSRLPQRILCRPLRSEALPRRRSTEPPRAYKLTDARNAWV